MNNENAPERVYLQTERDNPNYLDCVWTSEPIKGPDSPFDEFEYIRADLVGHGEKLWGHVQGLLTELDFPWQYYTEVTALEAITHIEEAISTQEQEIDRLRAENQALLLKAKTGGRDE